MMAKRAFLETADVDLKAQTVVSDRPVRLEMPGARVRADTMSVSAGGEQVMLRGRVVMDIRLDGGPLEETSPMKPGSVIPRVARAAIALATLALVAATGPGIGPAAAQGVTDAMSDFSIDSDQPVRIESDELEVRDRDQVAIFSGSVVVVQGDTTMRTPRLEVHYTGDGAVADAEQGDGAAQSISRLEARGGVVVETRDQKASGEWAVFEMATQEITLGRRCGADTGRQRAARRQPGRQSGDRVVPAGIVDRGGGGRVQGLFIPGGMGQKQD
jgi:lipopolysaccharide export system protein LptA